MMVRPHLRFPLITGFSRRGLFGLILLTVLGFLGNYFHWTLFFNIDFLFGSIAVWLVMYLYGAAWGTVVGAIAATCTYLLWNHSYAIITFTLEALFVGTLFHRRQHSIVLLDAIFWLVLGTPWIWLAYPTLLHIDPTQTQFILLKQSVNGVFNALVASQMITYLPIPRWVNRPPVVNQFPLQQALFNLLVVFVFFPTLILILLASHRVVDAIKADARADLNATSRYLAAEVRAWYQQHSQTISELAELIETQPRNSLQERISIDRQTVASFQAFYVIKSGGEVTQLITNPIARAGTSPSSMALPPSNLAFFKHLSHTLQPTLPDVFVEQQENYPAIAIFSAPLKANQATGWLVGFVNLNQIDPLLHSKLDEQELQVTLVDRQKTVIASTQADRVGMRNFDRRRNGEIYVLDGKAYHWLPIVGTPLVMARWTKSVFVQETLLDRIANWNLIVEMPARTRVNYIQGVYSQNLALLLLVAGFALALANLLSRYFVKPLTQLAVVTTNLPNKLLERETIIWSHSPINEIALLTRNFRSMATSLKQKFWEIQQVNESLEQRVQERTQALLQANAELEAEIAERQRIEAALRQSEEQLQLALKASRMGTWDWHLHTNQVIWSPQNEQLLGISAGSFDGTYEMFESCVHPDDRATIVQAATHAVQSQQEFYQEFRVVWADGSIHWMEGRGRLFCNQLGEPRRMVGTMVDITDRKQSELALQESRDLFGATFNQSTDAIFLVDAETALIFDCNHRAIELFEADGREELIGQQGITFHKHPWTPEEMAVVRQEICETGVWSSEIEYLTRKGNTFWGSISNKLFSIANKPLALVRITDISERRRAEAALQISEARNRALINAIPDLMIRMTREGIYLDFRPAKDFKAYMPYENMGGRSVYEAIPSKLAEERMRYVEQALRTGETQIYEFQILVDEQLHHEEARIVVSGEDEVLVIVRDMTEHKHTEATIRSRNQELLTLHKISETILSSQSLRVAFHAIAAEISEATGFPCIAIELYDAARQVMVFEGMKGIPLPPGCEVLEVPIDHTLSGVVATSGQAMVKNFAPQELKHCTANETLNQLSVKTFICMPMTVNHKTIGVLSLGHPEQIQSEDNFLRWVSSLANYLALITDRKQAEVSLRESEERLKLALEATQMGIWELNLLNNRATWAESCEMVYGLSPGSFEQTSEAFFQRIHPQDRELVQRNVNQTICENAGLNHEFRIIHPDGSIHWVLERGRVFCDEAGKATRLLGIAINITDRKQFEAFLQQTNAELGIQVAERTTELKEAIAQLHTEIIKRRQTQEELHRTLATNQALLSAIPDLILRVHRDGTYLDCVPTKEVRAVLPPEEQIGKNLQDILPRGLAQQRLGYIERAFQTGMTQIYEYQFLIDGSVRDEEARIVVSGDNEVVVLIRDITDRKQAERALQAAHEELTGWVNDLEQRHQEITLLNQMSDLLQACLTQEESCRVLTQLLPCLFPNSSGAVFLISDSQNPVEAITTWGAATSQTLFVAHECFALRRGQPHFVEDTGNSLCCYHLLHPLPATYCCVPMVARGKAIGVLYLCPAETEALVTAQHQLAITVAQQVALALANLKLYETLQNQSIRDPLTGLFNRRYLEESLTRELHRAQRSQQPLSLIVIDVDHFKRFNDTFGHDAGDAVLRELGRFLQSNVRTSDVACRFGGEEMVLILPETSLADARQRAEQLRQGVKQITIKHHQSLGTITISLGVACFPEQADSREALMKAADAALYRAKAEGRDRVATADLSR